MPRAIIRAAAVLLFLPLLIVLLVFGWDFAADGRPEPLADLLVTYLFLLVVYSPAAATVLLVFASLRLKGGRAAWLVYAVAGAAGSSAILLGIDVIDQYFTPGVGWHLPAVGFGLGAVFGLSFRALCGSMPSRTASPDPASL